MTEDAEIRMRPAVPVQLDDWVTRYIAPNAGVMTGPGTNGYWLGDDHLVLIDPGPAMPDHIDALLAHAAGRLRAILVTHTHRDHSPAAMALAERSGATVYGMPPPSTPENDRFFVPDHVVAHDEVLTFEDLSIQVIHTPGHASNHVCYLLHNNRMLFTGDHIMNGSTVVIAAPDGNMRQYLDSLELLKQYPVAQIAPGHGELLDNPHAVVDWIVAHRLQREAKVIERLGELAPCDTQTLLESVYDEVDPRLLPIARYSLLAHLGKLEEDGRVEYVADQWQVHD
ncbi:MAG: MBL fold metallo-hydrolase [Pseudomonadota bacterium]